MKTTIIAEKVYDVLKDIGIPAKALLPQASFQKDLGLDSLDFAELIMLLESNFSVELPILEMEKVTTIQAAIAYLTQRLSNKTN